MLRMKGERSIAWVGLRSRGTEVYWSLHLYNVENPKAWRSTKQNAQVLVSGQVEIDGGAAGKDKNKCACPYL
jgi:hypothetical protein